MGAGLSHLRFLQRTLRKITVFDPVDYLDSWEMVEAFG